MKGQSISIEIKSKDRKKKRKGRIHAMEVGQRDILREREYENGVASMANTSMATRNCTFVSSRRTFFADLTLFERSSSLRDHLTPTREGARRTRALTRTTAPLSAFIKDDPALLFFLSFLRLRPLSFDSKDRDSGAWSLYRLRPVSRQLLASISST